VQFTGELSSWTAAEPWQLGVAEPTGDGETEVVTAVDSVPLGQSPRRFGRVVVQQPE
jgi:hypothetical protein